MKLSSNLCLLVDVSLSPELSTKCFINRHFEQLYSCHPTQAEVNKEKGKFLLSLLKHCRDLFEKRADALTAFSVCLLRYKSRYALKDQKVIVCSESSWKFQRKTSLRECLKWDFHRKTFHESTQISHQRLHLIHVNLFVIVFHII